MRLGKLSWAAKTPARLQPPATPTAPSEKRVAKPHSKGQLAKGGGCVVLQFEIMLQLMRLITQGHLPLRSDCRVPAKGAAPGLWSGVACNHSRDCHSSIPTTGVPLSKAPLELRFGGTAYSSSDALLFERERERVSWL